jgi:hypothetical protein
MSIRTTVTLDDDVLERVKQESRRRGEAFRDTLNDLLRIALATRQTQTARQPFEIKPLSLGYTPGLNYDDIESLLEYGEGERHR